MKLMGVHIAVSRNVIKIHFDERWDHATYNEQFGKLLLYLGKHVMTSPWACMENLAHWQVRLPEQVAHCSVVADEMAASGLTHCAINANDMAISEWVMKSMLPASTIKRFFNHDQDCEDWLKSEGYDTAFHAFDIESLTIEQKALTNQS